MADYHDFIPPTGPRGIVEVVHAAMQDAPHDGKDFRQARAAIDAVHAYEGKEENDERLRRATALLREWRDKYGGRDVHVYPNGLTASPGDLVRDTTRFLEGK